MDEAETDNAPAHLWMPWFCGMVLTTFGAGAIWGYGAGMMALGLLMVVTAYADWIIRLKLK
jgi:hypothetical protein